MPPSWEVHSANKRRAASHFKGGYGFHPMFCFADATGEALAAMLRPGNAAANSEADQLAVVDDPIASLPPAWQPATTPETTPDGGAPHRGEGRHRRGGGRVRGRPRRPQRRVLGGREGERPVTTVGRSDSRRRRAALAGHLRDPGQARALLADPAPQVRATALAALERMGAATDADVQSGLDDPDPVVRRRACAVAVHHSAVNLVAVLSDPDAGVVEMTAWALGERTPAGDETVEALARVACDHDDALCREAAVAALGAIGDPRGLAAILAATEDRPAVRRRAVIALAPFDGPEVDAALARALDDRDWQVRQAAEELSGP